MRRGWGLAAGGRHASGMACKARRPAAAATAGQDNSATACSWLPLAQQRGAHISSAWSASGMASSSSARSPITRWPPGSAAQSKESVLRDRSVARQWCGAARVASCPTGQPASGSASPAAPYGAPPGAGNPAWLPSNPPCKPHPAPASMMGSSCHFSEGVHVFHPRGRLTLGAAGALGARPLGAALPSAGGCKRGGGAAVAQGLTRPAAGSAAAPPS